MAGEAPSLTGLGRSGWFTAPTVFAVAKVVGVDVQGQAFLDALLEVWGRGDAVWPIDHRLPPAAVNTLLATVRPHSVIEAKGEQRLPRGRAVEQGDALVVTTSGTTGTPKGVVLTHDAIGAAGMATSTALTVDPAADHWLCCLPVAHVAGLGVITRALVAGTALTIHDRFNAASVMESGASLVSLIPTTLRRIDAWLFRAILLGGASPPCELPPNVVTTWGMTETFGGVVYDGWPLPGTEVRNGPSGVLELRTPSLARCYRTVEGDQPLVDDDGWFATGDAGEVGAEGFVTVHGRADDVIVTGGEKVWPDRVEAALLNLAGVEAVAVVGRPDPEWGERVVAFVVPRPGTTPPMLADLREATGDLAPWEIPKELVLVGSLPRTALGKVRRSEVRRSLPD